MKTLIIFCACLATIPAFAVNKCTVNGKTVYQDTPCTSGVAEKIDARPYGMHSEPTPEPTRRASTSRSAVPDLQVDHQAVLNGMATGRPVVGMTENQLRIAMGQPDRVNTGDYQGRRSDQLIYERDGAKYYVYVRNGVVSSVQASQGYPSQASRKRCPTDIEIRNLRTSASSSTITEAERRELNRQVRRAENCL